MRKIIILLAGCSLVLAGSVIAQQPEGQESPTKRGGGKQKTEQATQGATETKPKGNAAQTRGKSNAVNAENPTSAPTGETQRGGKRGRGAKSETSVNAGGNATTNAESSPAGGATNATEQGAAGGKKGRKGRNATANTAAETGASASPGATTTTETGRKGRQGRGAKAANASPSPATSAPAATGAAAGAAASQMMTPPPASSATAAANANAATGGAGTGAMTKEQGTVGRGGKKVETQQVQQIKQQHASFRAQPRPDRAPTATFNQNYRISGAERWQGPQYEVFRSYHPEWHDHGWYRQRYGRVELIGGGYYFFNNGYWYPAWGYDTSAAYYPYDGPIYVGHNAQPPDRVIADVQAELQQMGYYTGEVDGLLGPLTRQALRDYQADHGLMVTEVIDEPTLDALQLS
jgi:Putative peptidoglycan binding domain